MTAVDPGRVRRSLTLTCEPLADGRYLVVGGVGEHVVQRDARGWRCDCLDARFNRGRPCKHRLAAHIHTRLDRRVVNALRSALEAS